MCFHPDAFARHQEQLKAHIKNNIATEAAMASWYKSQNQEWSEGEKEEVRRLLMYANAYAIPIPPVLRELEATPRELELA